MKSTPNYRVFFTVPLALFSGALLWLAMPPHDLCLLAWIAFIPLLIATRLLKPLSSAGCGVIAALMCGWLLAGHWETTSQFGNLIAAFSSLMVVFALVCYFTSLGASRLRSGFWPLIVGCAGVTAEVIGARLFPVSVALSQHQNPMALRIASFTGIWGVTFFLWFVPAAVIAFFISPRRAWPSFAIAVIIVTASILVPFPMLREGRNVTVAAVQAPDAYNAVDQTDMLGRRADIVVWPELLINSGERAPYDSAIRNHVYQVANYISSNSRKARNTACFISPQGKLIGYSEKQHLFGRENFSFVKGRDLGPFREKNIAAGIPICFDTEFTDITRRLVRRGANIILVPCSDPDIPNSMFSYMHSAVIPFRAAENGIPVVWAERNGLSSIFDGSGRRIAYLPPHRIGYVRAVVSLRSSRTFFTSAGDYFAYICILALLVTVVLIVCKKGDYTASNSKSRETAPSSSNPITNGADGLPKV